MTIIAYRDGVMACDSCWSSDEVVDNLAPKIHRLKSGALLGQAGDNDARDILALFATVRSPRSFPTLKTLHEHRTDFLGLLVLPTKRVFKVSLSNKLPQDVDNEDLGIWEILRPIAAVGSGQEIAVGAMAAGASARRAASIACQWVTTCRPPIHTRALIATASR